LYLSFKPPGNAAHAGAIQAMEKCIDAVRKWMIQDRLMINDDKTEFLLVGTRQQLDKLDSCSITVGNNCISPSPCKKMLTTLGARSFSAAAPISGMAYLWSFVKQHHLTVVNLDLKPIFLRSI
ncbi:unnamed protein product, partial [Porites evermanni]